MQWQARKLIPIQLKPYQSPLRPRTPRPQRTLNCAADPEAAWADDILGIDLCAHGVHSRSLQAEIDAYLLDTVTSSYPSVMSFWQVSDIPGLFLLFTHFS